MTVIIPDPPPAFDRELEVLRRQTREFIRHNPTTIIFTRENVKVYDGAGGFTITPGSPIDPQTFKLVPQSDGKVTRTIDGEEVNPDYVLLGEWNADVEMGDVFQVSGRNLEVIFVRLDHSYETWAEVVYRG